MEEDEELEKDENDMEEDEELEKDETVVTLDIVENPAAGTITPRNSSKSISPSLLMSPSWKMAATSVLLSFCPLGRTALLISCLVITPSPSISIFLKAATAPSLPWKVWLTLKTTAAAEGHITPMNSSISIAPSPLASPSLKMASISCSLKPAEAISDLLISPSPSTSSFLNPFLISSRVL